MQLIGQIAAVIGALEQIGTELSAAAASLPGLSRAEVTAFAASLAENLLSYLLISYLETIQPAVVGHLQPARRHRLHPDARSARRPGTPPYTQRTLRLATSATLLTSPGQLLETLTGWGAPGFDGTQLIPRLSTSLSLLGLTSRIVTPGPPNALEAGLVSIKTVPPGLLATLNYPLPDGFSVTLPLSALWSVQIAISGSFDVGLAATVTPPAGRRAQASVRHPGRRS